MSFRTVRYPSVESGVFNKRHNKCTVKLPADAGIVDLDMCKLVLRTHIQADFTIGGVLHSDVPFPVGFGACAGTQVAQSPQVLIKNVNSKSSALGILLPSRPYQNVLTNTLEWYTRSRSTCRSSTLFGTFTTPYYNRDCFSGIAGSPFFYPNRPVAPGVAVTAGPVSVTPELEIPMYCLDSRARGMRQFPCQVFGDQFYNIEFEDILTLVSASEGPGNIDVDDVTSTAGGLIGTLTNPLILTGISDINRCPLWAGQYINVTFTVGGEPATVASRVVSLTMTAGGALQVLVAPANDVGVGIPVGANDSECTNLFINWIQPTTLSWEILDVDLEVTSAVLSPVELQRALSIPMGPQGLFLPYMDYEQYQINVPQTQLFNYAINVGPGCVGVLSMFLANDSLVGTWNNVTEYSYQINNVNTADGYRIYTGYEGNNGNDAVGRQLHNTRIKQFFKNIGMQLRRYDVGVDSGVDLPNLLAPNWAMFPQVVPNVPVSQVVAITLRANSPIEDPAMRASTLYMFPIYKRGEQIMGGKVQIING
jgi:hypothetical protein